MAERFFTTEIEIPKGVPGISDLFAGLSLCSNGSIVVAYRQPIVIAGVNVGDETLLAAFVSYRVEPGFRIALDMRRLT